MLQASEELSSRRRWAMLAVSMLAQSASSLFANGAAFLIPYLHSERHLSLGSAGLLVAMPTLGFVLTLIAWGALVDRVGERRVLVLGLLLTALAGAAARRRRIPTCGSASSCCSAAWQRRARIRPVGGSSSAGSRRIAAASRWASGRWPSRSGSVRPR